MSDLRPAARIQRADFGDPALATFLQAHLDDLAPTAPAESRHALAIDLLQAPGVRLWVALEGTTIIGTGALAAMRAGHEEVKSMRTEPRCRGRGVARQLLQHLVRDARQRDVRQLSLETGSHDFFAPARALYASAGFQSCPPFGSYREDPNSVFMTKHL
ncbi:GNAT family N-acetyltransferase [Nocardioides sp. 616]|uniref:GNAT family N-acetyltransferase n=1 Tax=Nocardioides sp. 616 TaxID=2268090 RepID=UPI000CE3D1FC|nr:GNAT family N-acetyltransferase [Nocardioides sp. 616]